MDYSEVLDAITSVRIETTDIHMLPVIKVNGINLTIEEYLLNPIKYNNRKIPKRLLSQVHKLNTSVTCHNISSHIKINTLKK